MAVVLDGDNLTTTGVINSATAKTATGTAVDFTGIPAGTKRITVMFQGVSTNGTTGLMVQAGSGSVTTSGYTSGGITTQSGSVSSSGLTSTAGFQLTSADGGAAGYLFNGHVVITLISSNSWVQSGCISNTVGSRSSVSGGAVTLSGTLDRIRITTVNGTDTFDAGSINILYE